MQLAVDTDHVESLVRSVAPLVRRIAKHIAASMPASTAQDRLVQAGMSALFDAAKQFAAGSAREFEAYAVPRVRREMIGQLQGTTPIPTDVRRGMRDAEAAIARLERKRGRPPTDAEVASALGVSVDGYRGMLREARGYQIVSYDDDLDAPPGEREDPLRLLEHPELRDVVIEAIDELPERERLVMSLYHEHQLNHAEIGAVIGTSEPRVSEMYTQSVARIRVRIRQHQLRC